MKPWDIFTFDFPHGPHPVVIVSNPARVSHKPEVVILSCRSMRPGSEREPESHEVILDSSDGLDWKTLCRCDLLFTVPKAMLKERRGTVTLERRRDIARKIIQGLAIAGL